VVNSRRNATSLVTSDASPDIANVLCSIVVAQTCLFHPDAAHYCCLDLPVLSRHRTSLFHRLACPLLQRSVEQLTIGNAHIKSLSEKLVYRFACSVIALRSAGLFE